MKLSTLLAPWINTDIDCEITGLSQDSRTVQSGDLFFAYPGEKYDAREFISVALEKGAAAVIYDPENYSMNISNEYCIPLSQLTLKRGEIASRFYHFPTRAFKVIGVTGTNGKTTIAYLLAKAYQYLGQHSAYIGTLGQGSPESLHATYNTTPEPLALQAFFAEARHQHVQAMCMEVSSHALVQGRVSGVEFDSAIYTNLTHDHLDYHHTLEAYAKAKSLLFSRPELKFAVINGDDPYMEIMKNSLSNHCELFTYGLKNIADVHAVDISMTMLGSTFKVISPWGTFNVQTQLIGLFNIYNSLAIITQLLGAGFEISQVQEVISTLISSPGRMEIVHDGPCVIVDYAHTPDALQNALETVAQLKEHHLHVVFGCGGDRDKTKRPIMGKIASQYADHVMITSDNPRTEDPIQIINEIQAGILKHDSITIEVDRALAIQKVLSKAKPNDLILIAGKGHEDYQQIGQSRIYFSDQKIVKEFYGK